MQDELIEMIDFLFSELNKKVEFKVLQPTQKIGNARIKHADFDHLATCIIETLKPKLGNKFKIGADGIWKFWSKKEIGIQKPTPKILAAYFFVINGIEKVDDLSIKDARETSRGKVSGGKKVLSKNYWEKYVSWYKQRLTDETLTTIEYIRSETKNFGATIKEGIEYRIINDEYWEDLVKMKIDDSEMFSYYLDTNSSEKLLPHIVANKHYIPKENLTLIVDDSLDNLHIDITINELFNTEALPKSLLLKILGEGGEGKSTFLLHIAKEFCKNYNVLYFKINHSVDRLFDVLPKFDNAKPAMILIDDVRNHRERLEDYSESLKTKYPDINYVLIIAERKDRYKANQYFEDNFDKSYTTIYKLSNSEFGKLFDKFWEGLGLIYTVEIAKVSTTALNKYKKTFVESLKTVCDRIEELFNNLGISHTLKSRLEEWNDWDNNVNSHRQFYEIRNLYTITSLFYKFGIAVPIKFFEPHTQSLIIDALVGENRISSAIILDDENFLKLRHETKADKYFNANRKKVETYFDGFLDRINNKEAAKLFRNLYVHPEFKALPFLNKYLTVERCEIIFRKYLAICSDIEERGKTIIHLCRTLLYQQEISLKNKRVKEAIDFLENFIKEDKKNLQARATLSSLYIDLNPIRSYQLLNQLLQIDKNNVEAIVNLIVLYSGIKTRNKKFEDLLFRLTTTDGFNHITLLQVARRFLGGKRLIYATALLEFYVSKYSEHESDYLLERAYKKISELENYEDKVSILKDIGRKLFELNKRNLFGSKKQNGLRIKLVELFMNVEEWKFARIELFKIKNRQSTDLKLLNARIWANQGHYHSAYQILNALVKKEPVNTFALLSLIKVCKNYNKLTEARKYALQFLTVEPIDRQVMNLYLSILFEEVGPQRNKFQIVEKQIMNARSFDKKQRKAFQYILSGFYYKWAMKTTQNRISGKASNINISRHFSKEKLKLAIAALPNNEIYVPVKNYYCEALTEIDKELL